MRERESERARERESERVREFESERVRERESERAKERETRILMGTLRPVATVTMTFLPKMDEETKTQKMS